MPLLPAGTAAPHFSLPDQDGITRELSQYRGKWVLLYFYPKDDTPGCTVEACGLRDSFAELHKKNCAVLGVSADSDESHKRFSGKYELPFPLLADTDRDVIEEYGATKPKLNPGSSGIARVSYLIDPTGLIAKVYPHVVPEEHAQEVMADLDRGGD
jgi:thioredoxin-dependent peroxiredoxin